MGGGEKSIGDIIKEFKNKNLLIVVLVVIGGLIVLNYVDNTGFVIGGKVTKIEVSATNPPDINAGEDMYITIKPGSEGYDGNSLDIYQKIGVGEKYKKRVAELKVQYCGGNCNEERILKYKTSTDWGGIYYASIKDVSTGKEEGTKFEILN